MTAKIYDNIGDLIRNAGAGPLIIYTHLLMNGDYKGTSIHTQQTVVEYALLREIHRKYSSVNSSEIPKHLSEWQIINLVLLAKSAPRQLSGKIGEEVLYKVSRAARSIKLSKKITEENIWKSVQELTF